MTLADFDFETYSEAGYVFDTAKNRWRLMDGVPKGTTSGLGAVGAPAYAEHPTTEVLSLAYDLKNGRGPIMWLPGMAPPVDLFTYLASGGLIEAHNSGFEAFIWHYVCVPRMGWPEFDFDQLRCSMAKCRAWSIPAGLGPAAEYLNVPIKKDKDGKRLLNKFSKPRSPTKNDARLRITPQQEPLDAARLYSYNVDDIRAEEGVSLRVPDLSEFELSVWLLDQLINRRGVHIDAESLAACTTVIEQAQVKYLAELRDITGGQVQTASEVQKMSLWLVSQGVTMASIDADHVAEALALDTLPPLARRVLEIRAVMGSSSVKKVYSIARRLTSDGRLKELFAYAGADRTRRWAGRGPQPQNTPASGPDVERCGECGRHQKRQAGACLWCGAPEFAVCDVEWGVEAAGDALTVIALRDLRTVEHYFGDAVATVSGCLRGLYTAAPGHDFICSDFSAIEAVVLAALAKEEWRLEVFRTHGKIYEMSASMITGTPFQDYMDHKARTGQDHPHRKKLGKVAELASGFAGWIGAWKNFGADKHVGDDKAIKKAILAWREASPNIVEFWGGQVRKHPERWEFNPEFFGVEGCAVQAVLNPGVTYSHNGIQFGMAQDVLYIRLLSGRFLSYHKPQLSRTTCRMSGLPIFQITFMGIHPLSKKFVRTDTYGGKLTENIVQATARDIQANSLLNVEAAGYPVVLHVHDEIISEVPQGSGSIEHFEAIMSTPPVWASDWPIKAAGGWRGKRYRKD